MEGNIERTMRFFLRKVGGYDTDKLDMSFRGKALNIIDQLQGPEENWAGEPLLDKQEFQVYVAAIAEHGFTAPIHFYRNLRGNWKDMKRFLVRGKLPVVEKPCLLITAEHDFCTPPRLAAGMHRRCTPYERVDLEGCAHWLQMEKPEEVSSALRNWLLTHFV